MKHTVTLNPGDTLEVIVREEPMPDGAWAFPVGTQEYPPEKWYAASLHDPTGKLNNGYKHTGLDLNLDVSPWGDVDRGLPVYAVADGEVTYTTQNWSGVPMCVVKHQHEGHDLYVRYAHMDLEYGIEVGAQVLCGDVIGRIANYSGGDHLHFDIALDWFTREWLAETVSWVDPVPVLKAHLDPAIVDQMLARW